MSIGFGLMELVLLLAVGGGWTAFTVWSWGHLRARTLWRGEAIRWRLGVVGIGFLAPAVPAAWAWITGAGGSPAWLAVQAVIGVPFWMWAGYGISAIGARNGLLSSGDERPGR